MRQNIKRVPRKVLIKHHFGDTSDIINVIMTEVNKGEQLATQVHDFAQQFKANTKSKQYKKLKDLHAFVRSNIEYQEDPPGIQDIKYPARTWEDGYADCKSLTVFIYSCCYAIGIPCYIDFASYNILGQVQHVYPVAILGNQEVTLDACLEQFDVEETYTNKVRKTPNNMTKIRVIKGLPALGETSKGITKKANQKYTLLATDGELELQARFRNLQVRAAVNHRKGNRTLADRQDKVAKHLDRILKLGIHDSNTLLYQGGEETDIVNNWILKAANNKQDALRPSQSLQRKSRVAGPFSATTAQRQACINEAEIIVANDPIANTFSDDAYDDYIAQVAEECINRVVAENILNTKIEQTGAVMLYALMPDNTIAYNIAITRKWKLQNEFIVETSRELGISEEVVRLALDTGAVEALQDFPEDIQTKLAPYMSEGGASIGAEPLTVIAAVKLIGAIVGIVKKLFGAVKSVIDLVKEDKNALAYFNIDDPSILALSTTDFNGDGAADTDTDGDGEVDFNLFAPKNLLIGFGVALATDMI